MTLPRTRQLPQHYQHLLCIVLVLLVSGISFSLNLIIGYKVIALILLMTVSILAMLFDILPVLIAAVLSALIWNFFFIPPVLTFHIDNIEDLLMFSMYFLIAMVNAVLTFKLRDVEKKAREKEEKDKIIMLYNTLFNSLSHELRTPISTIIGALDTLKENKSALSPENETALLSVIDHATIRLDREVNNLLNMSRLESGLLKLKPDWCDVSEVIHMVIRKLDPEVENAISFSPGEELPLFMLDAGILEQIIHNLIHNAITHNPEGTRISIKALHQEDACVIMIADNGKGFPEDEIPFLFDKFYRLTGSRTPGSGLGLSIVKGFVEAHNGHVTIENSLTGGAQITITIPAETTYIANLKNE